MSDLRTAFTPPGTDKKINNPSRFLGEPTNTTPGQSQLPADLPEPSVISTAPHHFLLNNSRRNSLNAFANQHGTSLSVLLLTAFKTLVYRHTNQADLITGFSHYHYESTNEKLVEYVKKIQPVRTNLSGNLLFTDLLQQVQKLIDGCVDNLQSNTVITNSYSVENDKLSPGITIAFVNKTAFELSRKEAARNNYKIPAPQDGVELKLTLMSDINGVVGFLEYNPDSFEAEQVFGMMEHYEVLLDEVIINPTQSITNIRILREAERNKLLYEWNQTESDFPRDKCIHELFEEQAKRTPDAIATLLHPNIKVAVHSPERQLTYAALNEKANQLASYLQHQGVGPDVLVGVCMKRSLELVIAIMGILKAGGAYLPVDPDYPAERLQFIVSDAEISILLSQSQLMESLPAHKARVICLDTEWAAISTSKKEISVTKVSPQNLAYVIYTSGSTGRPKGTLITHSGVVNYLTWCINAYNVKAGNGSPVNTSIGFDATVTSFLSPLLAGKTITLLPEDGEIEALVDVLQTKNNFSLIKITPAHLEILNNLLTGKDMAGTVNALVIGGEALTGKSLNFWRKYAPGIKLINEYGPTETVVGCCIYEVPLHQTFTGVVPIGRPIANTQMYILDNNMQPTPTGVPGEIYIGGAGVARGYLNRPELTAERFLRNPFSNNPSDRIYKTGDIARYLPDGNIVFLGRTDSQVKIRGYRIELGEIEYALQQCASVKQAVVRAKEDAVGDKQLLGYFVPHPAALQLKEEELHSQQVANWKGIYETEYGQTEKDDTIDPEFNIIGWNDSFTGGAIPAPQMQEWLDGIVEVIMAQQPRRLLEIGCGTGLIFYRLAGKLEKYTGADLSTSSIIQIKEQINKGQKNYGQTHFFTAPAHLVALPQDEPVDTILLNSMVQYFPGETYMNAVMEKCMAIIKNRGRIIVGDVRDLRLLKLFKGRIKLQKSNASTDLHQFAQDLEQDVMNEEELCFSPNYFYQLKNIYPQITHIDIQWKKATYLNELSLYRYTVVIHVGVQKEQITPEWQNWNEVADKSRFLYANGLLKTTVALKNVPNPRLWKEKILEEALQDKTYATVGDMVHATEQESDERKQVLQLLSEAESKGYHQKLFVHEDGLQMNVLLELKVENGFAMQPFAEKIVQEDEAKTNMPLFKDIIKLLQDDIRKTLSNNLPEYMVPSALIALRQLPLTPNGKIDDAALPTPAPQRNNAQKTFTAGRDQLEIELLQLFEKYIGIDNISVDDNLFELGINSMQAYRLFAQVKKITRIQLPLSILIKAPTVEKLAIYLKGEEAGLPWSSLVPIQPNGAKPPLYLIHAGAGTVLFYRDLSRHLGEDQPVYGLQPLGLDGKQNFHKSVAEMAQHYIHEIRAANPLGPYLLGGYCFGAVIAFEMAQQLKDAGFETGLLANFNGVSPAYDENVAATLFGNSNQPKGFGNAKKEEGVVKAAFTLNRLQEDTILSLKKARRTIWYNWRYQLMFNYIDVQVLLYKCYRLMGKNAPENLRKFYFLASNDKMVNAYKPKPYAGRLTIFRSPQIYPDPYLGWKEFVTGGIEVCDIPGHHKDRREIMNEPFVQTTAKELNNYIAAYLQQENAISAIDKNSPV